MLTHALICRAELDTGYRPGRYLEAGGGQMYPAGAQCRVDLPVAAHRRDLQLDAELVRKLAREIVLRTLGRTVLREVIRQRAGPCCNAQLAESLDLVDQTRE